MVDLFYDHFLAKEWPDYCDLGFDEFLTGTRRVVNDHLHLLPARLRSLIPYIFSDLLPSYSEPEGISLALERMSGRLKRRNRLGEGGIELMRNYEGLRSDFHRFIPELREFVEAWKASMKVL